jgi:hypothetical protein
VTLTAADTDGLIREEVPVTTTLPSFMTANTASAATTAVDSVKLEADANVPDDIANFYQVIWPFIFCME